MSVKITRFPLHHAPQAGLSCGSDSCYAWSQAHLRSAPIPARNKLVQPDCAPAPSRTSRTTYRRTPTVSILSSNKTIYRSSCTPKLTAIIQPTSSLGATRGLRSYSWMFHFSPPSEPNIMNPKICTRYFRSLSLPLTLCVAQRLSLSLTMCGLFSLWTPAQWNCMASTLPIPQNLSLKPVCIVAATSQPLIL